jgi:hypothetical protein
MDLPEKSFGIIKTVRKQSRDEKTVYIREEVATLFSRT